MALNFLGSYKLLQNQYKLSHCVYIIWLLNTCGRSECHKELTLLEIGKFSSELKARRHTIHSQVPSIGHPVRNLMLVCHSCHVTMVTEFANLLFKYEEISMKLSFCVFIYFIYQHLRHEEILSKTN